MTVRRAAALTAIALMCAPVAHADQPFTYLGQAQIPSGFLYDGTVVGGLSGISYNPVDGLYYLISDDRSAKNPARFYTARIPLSNSGIGAVEWVDTTPFQGLPVAVPPDPEGIAVDTRRQRLYWSSEGARNSALLDPWVRVAGYDGAFLGEFALPPGLRMSVDEQGPRDNEALEGLTLTPSGEFVYAAVEGTLYNDGAIPSEADGALARVTRFDAETGLPTAQFAYPLDKVTAGPGGGNGLSDLAALDDGSFLTVERGYGTHVEVRIYRSVVGDADDVLGRSSLLGAPVRTMTKTLLADLADVAGLDPLDNIEGITLGPLLPDGRQSVVLVSDDNFRDSQVTQFLLFAF
ncbi:esterase-like activity of phytase family protein [soil metagenome]